VQLQALFRSSTSIQLYSCEKNSAWHTLWYIWLEQRYSGGFGYRVWKSREVLCARQHPWHQQTCSCTTQDQLLDLLNPLVQSSVSIMNIELIVRENIWPGPIAQDFTMMSPVVAKNHCSKHWYRVCFCCTPAVRCYHLICHLISGPLVISCLWQDWIQLKISSWSLSVWKLGPVNLRFQMLHYSCALIVCRSDKWSVSLQLLQLLLKASQDDHFVCEEAERTLTGMTTSISPEPMLQKLQPYVSHQNPWVQAKAVMCMDNSVVRPVCPFGMLDHNHRLCCKSLGFRV